MGKSEVCYTCNVYRNRGWVLWFVSTNKILPRLMAGVQDTFMTYEIYDDVITLRLVQEACKMLGEYHFVFCSTNQDANVPCFSKAF